MEGPLTLTPAFHSPDEMCHDKVAYKRAHRTKTGYAKGTTMFAQTTQYFTGELEASNRKATFECHRSSLSRSCLFSSRQTHAPF